MRRHRMAMAALTMTLVGGGGLAPARADEPGAIAVLPLSSPERRLEMYGVAISRALAGELRGRTSAPIQAVSGSSELPPRISWVIDGRIVGRSRGLVVLEARVRDPSRGRAFGQVASRPGRLTEIDRLAKDLASQLAPLIARAEV